MINNNVIMTDPTNSCANTLVNRYFYEIPNLGI